MIKYSKILCINSFYSSASISIGKVLSNKVDALITDLGYLVYLRGASKIDFYSSNNSIDQDYCKQINPSMLADLKYIYLNGKVIASNNINSDILKPEINRWYYFLLNYLVKNEIECVIIHNKYRWINSVVLKVCKEIGIDCLVLERGYYRPLTTTYEYWSSKENAYIYPFKKISKEFLTYGAESRSTLFFSFYMYFSFFVFLLLNKIGNLFDFGLKIPERDFSIRKYTLALLSKFSNISQNFTFLENKKIILVALQLDTDSNFVIYSGFKTLQDYIYYVISSYEKIQKTLDDRYELVFKFHPEQLNSDKISTGNYRSILKIKNILQLENNINIFLTVNSTYTTKFIESDKKIICISGCAFDIPGLTHSYNSTNLSEIINSVISIYIKKNECSVEIFDNLNKNQIGFDLFDYSKSNLISCLNV